MKLGENPFKKSTLSKDKKGFWVRSEFLMITSALVQSEKPLSDTIVWGHSSTGKAIELDDSR